eukprot:gene38626-59018_t
MAAPCQGGCGAVPAEWAARAAQIADGMDIDRLREDMGIDERARFTRKQAAYEAQEGSVVFAAYQFCHLRPPADLKEDGAARGGDAAPEH